MESRASKIPTCGRERGLLGRVVVGDDLGVEANAAAQEPRLDSKYSEHLSSMTLQEKSTEESGARRERAESETAK